jgi:putative tryptophan/tyrosine transport system substrate-binding protein
MRRPVPRHARRQLLRGSLALAGLGVLSGCGMLPPPPRQSPPMRRIGFFGDVPSANWDALVDGLYDLGWVEGANLGVERRWAEEDRARWPALADELVRLQVECIAAGPVSASLAAKQATTEIPIVAILVTGEALENGVVDNIARPGGNVTGMAGISGADLQGKLLQILRETVPGAARIAVLYHLPSATVDYFIPAVERAAVALRLEARLFPFQGADALPRTFSEIRAVGAEALLIIPSPSFNALYQEIAALAVSYRLPSINNLLQYAQQEGGLMAYGVSRPDVYRRAATYIDRILKGGRPGDLPMERPSRFDLVLNLKTARALGLTIPRSVLIQATEVIE